MIIESFEYSYGRQQLVNGGVGTLQIIVIRRHCNRVSGGAERYCADLCVGLRDLGHEVTLIGESCEEELAEIINFVHIQPICLNSATKNWSFHVRAQEKIRTLPHALSIGLSRTYPVDVYRLTERLHAHNIATNYRSSLSKLWTKVSPRHRVLMALESRVLSRHGSKAIITISRLDRTLIQQYYGVSSDRIHVVYNGVDHKIFNPTVRQKRETVRKMLGIDLQVSCYIFPAMDFEKKGLRNLMLALRALDFPWVLLVVGGGKTLPYRKLAKRLGIGNRVLFLGRRNDLNSLYGAADLMVFPAEYEPFGNVHLEALACGLPVVTTKVVGGSEVVRPYETGYVIDSGKNIEALTWALKDYEKRRLHWEKMSRLAARSAEEFTVERNAKQVEAILVKLSQSRRQAIGS